MTHKERLKDIEKRHASGDFSHSQELSDYYYLIDRVKVLTEALEAIARPIPNYPEQSDMELSMTECARKALEDES